MRKFLVILCIALICAFQVIVASSNDAQDSNEQFIQGSWRIAGQLAGGRFAWFKQWKFENGKFELVGYPPLKQSGRYRILKDEGNKLTLELYDQQGTFGTKNSKLEIVVYRDKDQLKIDNSEPFNRIKDKR